MPPVQASDTTNVTPRSSSPHRPYLPDDNPPAATRTPGSHPCSTTWPPATFRTAAKSLRAAVANLKIGPAACRPHPSPPPSRPTNSAACPAAEPAGKSTFHQKQSPPPDGCLPCRQSAFRPSDASGRAARLLINPLADRRHADPKDARNGVQRAAFLVHRQGTFFVGGAGSLTGSIGGGAASAVASVINLAAFGGAVFGHPVGAAFGAADIVAIDVGRAMRIPPGRG